MKLEVSLSQSSIDSAIAALEAYAESLPQKVDSAVGEAVDRGYEVARQTLSGYPQPFATGQLASSFAVNHTATSWELRNDSDHAAFFEFGTGVVGSRNPYPYEFPVSWSYDQNGHGDAGWQYSDDGRLRWTRGLPSRPFMAPAAAVIRSTLPGLVRGALR